MNKAISNLKKVTELRNELKALSIKSFISNESELRAINCVSKNIGKIDIVETFLFNGQPNNFIINFSYINGFDSNNGVINIIIKEENTFKIIFSQTIKFPTFKFFLKDLILMLKCNILKEL